MTPLQAEDHTANGDTLDKHTLMLLVSYMYAS